MGRVVKGHLLCFKGAGVVRFWGLATCLRVSGCRVLFKYNQTLNLGALNPKPLNP